MSGTPSFNEHTRFGLAMRFDVVIGGMDLGGWSSCDGLKVDFGLLAIRSGGNNDFDVYLPDKMKYTNLTLKRGINARDSAQVMSWLRAMKNTLEGQDATVTLRDSHNEPVSEWTFASVRPKSWKGPTLGATTKEVAMEMLELVHEGFL